jgi:ribosomal protein L7/L12
MDLPLWLWLTLGAFAAVLIFRIGVFFGRAAADAERIQPIAPTRISPEARARIDDALRNNEKIAAIKILRADTGCGLAEAKQTVEALFAPPGS